MNGMSEAEMIQKLVGKDESAFRQLVNTYHQMAGNTCYGIVKNQHDTEDVAPEVFIEVFRSVQNFRADMGNGSYGNSSTGTGTCDRNNYSNSNGKNS